MTIAERTRGERALWASVVLQIVLDATSTSTGKAETFARDEAIAWCARRTRVKDRLLKMAGITDPDTFWSQADQGFPRFRATFATVQHRSNLRRNAA